MKRSSVNHSIGRQMKAFILMKNHSAAQSVIRNSVGPIISRPMKESTLFRNHSKCEKTFTHAVSLKEYTKFNQVTYLKTHERITLFWLFVAFILKLQTTSQYKYKLLYKVSLFCLRCGIVLELGAFLLSYVLSKNK